jgi:hypothetical protein
MTLLATILIAVLQPGLPERLIVLGEGAAVSTLATVGTAVESAVRDVGWRR